MKNSNNKMAGINSSVLHGFILGLLVLVSASVHGASTLVFFDGFDGPNLNPRWTGGLPDAPCAAGDPSTEKYLGAPNYQFQILGQDSVLRMSSSLSDLQRVGWSLNTNFYLSDFRYEARFNTLVQSQNTSIDSCIEIWVMDAANSNRYDIVSIFGGSYGTDRRFRAGSSISGSRFDQPLAYQDNTYYRLVLTGNSTNNIRASLLDDQGVELAAFDLGHSTTNFSSGFQIAISQSMDRPLGSYPSDVAVDYVSLTTDNYAMPVTTECTPGVLVSWPSEIGRWYQVQLKVGSGNKSYWANYGAAMWGNGSELSSFVSWTKEKPQYRVMLLP